MAANTYLQATELDFNEIRDNLKSYLKSQESIKDFDYEGSVMAVLLDLLAYNTHYNSYYVNMLANEMFLDTAQQRDSVVSRAKELGYTPLSASGAMATVTVRFTDVPGTTSQLTIPKYSKFKTTVDDVSYNFLTTEAHTVINEGGQFEKQITIKEGTHLTHRFVVDANNPKRYILPNPQIDSSSISVKIQNSVGDETTVDYTRATNINQIFSTSPVYFLEEAYDEKYEIIFGKGALGLTPKSGNIIIVDYVVCNGEESNGAKNFEINSQYEADGTAVTAAVKSVDAAANGGRYAETLESIKFNAPKSYQTQNRCVVDNDYERIILSENPDIQSVVAYGGENAISPTYGKVFIGLKPFGEQFLTLNRKNEVKESIQDRTPLAVDALIVDPEYTYIIADIKTYYDRSSSNATIGEVELAVREAIINFSSNNLERFGNRLRYSRFVRSLDNITVGNILNNDAEIKMQRRFVPDVNVPQKIELYYNNKLRPGTLNTSEFTYRGFSCFFDDDSFGNIGIYRYDDQKQKIYVDRNVGTVDYENGIVTVEGFQPTAYSDIEMRVTVTPDRFDVIPVREQILIMDPNDATIEVISEYT
jgi:hypothetical protein